MSRNIYMPNINGAIVEELREINKKLDKIMGQDAKIEVKEYYLWDKFYSRNDGNGGEDWYLNYNTEDCTYGLSSNAEVGEYITKFTDEDIERLDIPIDRFEKEEVL